MSEIEGGLAMRWLVALILVAVAPYIIDAPAWADSVVIQWDPAPDATSYDVQRATTMAGPWTVVGANLACTTSPCSYTDTTAPATGSVFYRLVTKNASASNILAHKGLWYCGDCAGTKLPGSPTYMQHVVTP
jgi:hypothetical protein